MDEYGELFTTWEVSCWCKRYLHLPDEIRTQQQAEKYLELIGWKKIKGCWTCDKHDEQVDEDKGCTYQPDAPERLFSAQVVIPNAEQTLEDTEKEYGWINADEARRVVKEALSLDKSLSRRYTDDIACLLRDRLSIILSLEERDRVASDIVKLLFGSK